MSSNTKHNVLTTTTWLGSVKNRGAWRLTALCAALSCSSMTYAEDTDSSTVFKLGEVVVRGDIGGSLLLGETTLHETTMERFNRNNIGSAATMIPGVTMASSGQRNEQTVSIRGFDSRRIAIFMDGIPQYVPYDGNVDLNRFTTFDLSTLTVAKGNASLLYGPNVMGGAINLVSRKPEREFEGDVRVGYASGQERLFSVNAGSRQEKWYFQFGASYLDANGFPLPKDFHDQKKSPTDLGSYRENGHYTDKKLSFKLGLTPNATDEYVFGYVRQEGKKGQPVYTGERKGNRFTGRFWQWPYWDKDSLYFMSSTDLGSDYTLRLRAYADTYKNGMDNFRDASYTELQEARSKYDDKTYGAAAELVIDRWANHELHVAFNYKDDRHKDIQAGYATKNYRDITYSLAIEDYIRLSDTWRMRAGLSHDRRKTKDANVWESGAVDKATNGVLELVHNVTPSTELFGSVAHKTHFATIKDRYSASFGEALPNPDLKPEKAWHYELGLRTEAWEGGQLEFTLFRSNLRDAHNRVDVPGTVCGKYECRQYQNIDRARHQGIELSLEQQFSPEWRAGLAYTYLNSTNRSEPDVKLTGLPRNRLFAHVGWKPHAQWEFLATLEAENGRYDEGVVDKYEQLSGYGIVGLKTIWSPRSDLSIEAGVRNLGDKYYELSEGYPMPGRVWFANAIYRF